MQKHEKMNYNNARGVLMSMNERLHNELVYDKENDEWVTWNYLDKVTTLRKKHKDYYKNSKAVEKSYINSQGSIKRKERQRGVSDA